MQERVTQLTQECQREIEQAANGAALQEVKVRWLGRKGVVTQLLRGLGDLPATERPRAGQVLNQLRQQLEASFAQRESSIIAQEKAERLERERLDLTLPGRRAPLGHLHPLTQALGEIKAFFIGMGYQVVEGPEVETDYYNFQALNVPKDHPARDMQATFYLAPDLVLRTQTSPVQVRTMERQKPPIRIIAPGKVYRNDADITHSPMFHQVEGLVVDEGIRFSDLKGTLIAFAKALFGQDRRVRFRPSYFPFTEPSAEMDISCTVCGGKGCRVCKGEGWLEILGSGMVHPQVLEMAGYDPERLTGWAFGMGVERVAMLRYGIEDIRLLFENDRRFLAEF
ncbi:MAG: phenylalanine--tRNA ligase subunit alpha [Limnochordaceae bacterium]|nr:phenylalanine--tRNA ligase subunit alpha [Limnochordaceae bacterium]